MSSANPHGGGSMGPTGGVAAMGPGSVSNATKEQLARLEKDMNSAKADYDKAATDAKAKKKYVDATVKYATATMLSNALDAKVKYREALRLYREALKVDPSNTEAGQNKELIEGIYKQMGRPIPE